MKDEKIILVEKQKTKIDRAKDWLIIIFSVGSIFTFSSYYLMLQDYRQEIRDAKTEMREKAQELEIKFDTSMAYDSATQSKLSAYIERHPQNRVEVQACIQEVKTELFANLKKRKLIY